MSKKRGGGYVMTGFVARATGAVPIISALRSPDRHRRDKPGDDEAITKQLCRCYTPHFFG